MLANWTSFPGNIPIWEKFEIRFHGVSVLDIPAGAWMIFGSGPLLLSASLHCVTVSRAATKKVSVSYALPVLTGHGEPGQFVGKRRFSDWTGIWTHLNLWETPKFYIERQAFDKRLCPLYHGVVEVCSCHKTLVRHVGTRFSPTRVKVANCIIRKHFLQNLLSSLRQSWFRGPYMPCCESIANSACISWQRTTSHWQRLVEIVRTVSCCICVK